MTNLLITPVEEAACFKLLDDYARLKHKCFVSEFFRSTQQEAYSVCVRPLLDSETDPNRYASKYLQFSADDVRAISAGTSVPPGISDVLDNALAKISAARE